MAPNTNANGQQAQSAVESVLQRWALIGFLGIAGPVSGFAMIRLLAQLDTVVTATNEMKTDVAVMKTDIGYLKERLNK